MRNVLKIITVTFLLCILFGCNQSNKEFTLTFDTDGGNKIEDIYFNKGESINAPTASKDGYRFMGWYIDDEKFSFYNLSESVTVKAKYEKLYYITFDIEQDKLAYIEGEVILLPKPSLEGFEFLYYEHNNQEFKMTTMPSYDIHLSAKFKDVPTIYFTSNLSDVVIPSISKIPGTSVDLTSIPFVEGYIVKRVLNDDRNYVLDTMPNNDLNLKVIYEKIEHTSLPSINVELYNNDFTTYYFGNVNREDYVDATVSINNSNYNLNLVNASFKGRGNGSWFSAKKGYNIKFDTSTSLLGEDDTKHWSLLACMSGDTHDKTLLRNDLAFQLGKNIFDNIEYTSSSNLIDFYVNGEYQGVYLLAERVRDENTKVDVDAEFGILDTGYLIEYDAYASEDGAVLNVDYFRVPGLKYGFSVKSPNPDDYLEEGLTIEQYMAQIEYIKDYTTKVFTAALNNNYEEFCKYADKDSFIDMYILHELLKNTDTGWSSFYLSKKAGEKMEANAPWDFDMSSGIQRGSLEGDTYKGIYVASSIQGYSSHTASELYISLYKNNEFRNDVKVRWNQISKQIENFINDNYFGDSLDEISDAIIKNNQKWFGGTYDYNKTIWYQETNMLISWLNLRINWLNEEWSL